MSEPPRQFRHFVGLPWTWWVHIPHKHVALYCPATGGVSGIIRCCICWQRLTRDGQLP